MQTVLYGIQIVLALAITVFILLQAQGTGLGSTWSGGGETYHTKRGLEKVLYYATMVCIGLFVCVSVALLSNSL